MNNKQNLLDFIKEAQNVQPMLNLNTVTKQSLPQITTGLQNVVKAQEQLKQQQQKMIQQQQAQQKTAMVPQTGMPQPALREVETMTTHNQDKSPMGISDKNSPSDPMPIPMAGAQATQTVQEEKPMVLKKDDIVKKQNKIKEQNFVKSKMFSIIAENEAPRISKGDFINHIKNRSK